ncbi:MAG: DUF4919 domain-containing protein [Rikenellaceae bacterium]
MFRGALIGALSAWMIVSTVAICEAKTPDEEDVLSKITDAKSAYYYPDMMLKFEMGDINLTLDQYHYLYYGYVFQEEYAPTRSNPNLDKVLQLAASLDMENPNAETLREVINIADGALRVDPFNLKVWNILAYAYGALDEKIKEREAFDRVEKILSTINNSGDGLTPKTPKHILAFDHATDMMAAENLTTAKPMIVSRTVEFVPLVVPRKVEGKKFRGYYFDYGRVYINKPDSVTFKRDRTWQFNNLKPREYK